jgi:gas vesicle protein
MSEQFYTLAGAVVGGLIGVVGTMGAAHLTGRSQRRSQHEQWRRQVRRDAYSAFITRAAQAIRQGHSAHEAAQKGDRGATDLIKELGVAAAQVEQAATLVSLEGPEDVSDGAANIQIGIGRWHRALCTATGVGPEERQDAAWGRALDASTEVEDGLEEFTVICRRLLDGRADIV